MRHAREIPNITETLPVFGSGAERLSEVKKRMPKIRSPKKEIFLYLRRTKTNDATPNENTINT
jgi:hypothetical protein